MPVQCPWGSLGNTCLREALTHFSCSGRDSFDDDDDDD